VRVTVAVSIGNCASGGTTAGGIGVGDGGAWYEGDAAREAGRDDEDDKMSNEVNVGGDEAWERAGEDVKEEQDEQVEAEQEEEDEDGGTGKIGIGHDDE
jgi:hypothetical protein